MKPDLRADYKIRLYTRPKPRSSRCPYFGVFAAARHGAMFRQNMVTGIRSIDGSDVGTKPGYGRSFLSPWPRSWRTVVTTASIAPQFVPMSWQRAEKGAHRRALGRSRGGFTSKLHCLADGQGRPLAFHLTVGEAADCKAYDVLIDLPERAPDALLADKGYDADAIRVDLDSRSIKAVIPGQSNRRVKISSPIYL